MILLSRLGGPAFALNPDLIERAETTPDTVVTLVGGNKYVIRESLTELIELIVRNRAEVIAMAEQLRAESQGSSSTARGSHRSGDTKRDISATPTVVPLHPRES